MKKGGYHLEHNFGHGKENLSMVLFTLNMLSFLIHEIQRLTNNSIIEFFKTNPRYVFWEKLKAIIEFFVFTNFEELIDFILNKKKFLIVPI